jgi:hypothetical protein
VTFPLEFLGKGGSGCETVELNLGGIHGWMDCSHHDCRHGYQADKDAGPRQLRHLQIAVEVARQRPDCLNTFGKMLSEPGDKGTSIARQCKSRRRARCIP